MFRKEHHNICFHVFCPYILRRRIHLFLRRLSLTKITETVRIIIQEKKKEKTILVTVPRGVLVVDADNFDGIYAQVRVRPSVSVSVHVCVTLYDSCVHVCFYIATYLGNCSYLLDSCRWCRCFLPIFHRFSIVVGCGIWLPYFMIITFCRHIRAFALTFQKFRANVIVTIKFHIQYN